MDVLGSLSLIVPYSLCERKAASKKNCVGSELSCVEEEAVLGSPSLIVRRVAVDVKQI